MAVLAPRLASSLTTNPPIGNRTLTHGGSDWLWAVFAIFILSFLIHALFIARPLHGEKIFHYIFTVALLTGAIAYFAMASGLGSNAVRASTGDRLVFPSYQIFWPKYAYWAVAFPCVILALGLLSGISWATILFEWALAWLWIFTYYIAARTATNYKWGFFAFGTVAYLLLAHLTMTLGRTGARRLGVGGHYSGLAGLVNLLWMLYPIAFGLSDGGNKIGPTAGHIFFGILDLLLVPLLSFAFVTLARRWDYGRLGLNFTRFGRVPGDATTYPAKSAPVAGAPGVGTPGVAAPATAGARV